jgi:hypothetical protein
MAPNDTRTPFQIAQAEEARNRQQTVRDDAGNETGGDPHQDRIDDGTGNDLDPARRLPDPEPRAEDQGRDEPKDRRSPGDIKRAEMAARFRKRVTEQDGGDVPYNGDPNDPEMKYGKFGRADDGEPDPGATVVGERPDPEVIEHRQEQEPQKKKLIIRGREVWLTDAEILARASQVEAADTYLQESKDLLAEARDIRNSAKRTGQDPQHPEDRTGTQEDEPNLDTSQERQHPDELEQAIEEIQFGDPKDAAAKIRKVITQASDESADKRQLTRLIDNDLATSQKALKEFMDQNPDLAKDKVANVVLEQNMYDIYREDITKLGVDPALIPKDNNELANWHRFYRVNGKPVRSTTEALKEAKTQFDKWRGVAPKPAQQQRQQPRIDVNVDRTARRENIQNQPTRAVAPRPDAVRQAPTTKSRSDVIMGMRRQRGQVTG